MRRVRVVLVVLAVASLSVWLLVVPTRAVAAEGDVVWTREFGTTNFDGASAVAVYDSLVYVAGETMGTLPGQTSSGGYSDVFLRQYGTAGNVVWTRQFGTAAADQMGAVAADGSGVYVTGTTQGAFPGQASAGDRDVYVRKYDAAGNVVWTRQFGSAPQDWGYGVAVDASGVYVAGTTMGALPGQTSFGWTDAFVRKYDTAGNLVWTRQFGTAASDGANGVAADGSGVYVAGGTPGTLSGQASVDGGDAFLRKYSLSGSVLWTRQFTAPLFSDYGDAGAAGVAIDGASSRVYVVGWTLGVFPGQSSSGGTDAFLKGFTSAGEALWTRQFGTAGEDWATGVAADASGAYAVGHSYSDPVCWEGCEISVFVARYTVVGNPGWSRSFEAGSIAVAAGDSSLLVAGTTSGRDAFVRRYDTGVDGGGTLVLFVEGVTSSESCGRPKTDVLGLFGFIKDQVLPNAEFRVFSYAPSLPAVFPYVSCADSNWPTADLGWSPEDRGWTMEEFGWHEWPRYAAGFTCTSIDGFGGHSDRFRQWYEQVTEGYDDVYVLAHSMGGVVVANALATWPGGVPANLRGVVTLDSPLQGQPLAPAHSWISGGKCPPDADAYADLNPDSSPVIQTINPPASVPWRGLVTAIGNNQDLAVWASYSHLPGAWLNLRIDRGCAGIGDHNCVFRDADSLGAIGQSLLNRDKSEADGWPSSWKCSGVPANVVGSPKADGDTNRLDGGPGDDVIAGLGGNDLVFGGGGNDRICGGSGSDALFGDAGRDRLFGQGGNDTLIGGLDLDTANGGPGTDTCVAETTTLCEP